MDMEEEALEDLPEMEVVGLEAHHHTEDQDLGDHHMEVEDLEVHPMVDQDSEDQDQDMDHLQGMAQGMDHLHLEVDLEAQEDLYVVV